MLVITLHAGNRTDPFNRRFWRAGKSSDYCPESDGPAELPFAWSHGIMRSAYHYLSILHSYSARVLIKCRVACGKWKYPETAKKTAVKRCGSVRLVWFGSIPKSNWTDQTDSKRQRWRLNRLKFWTEPLIEPDRFTEPAASQAISTCIVDVHVQHVHANRR